MPTVCGQGMTDVWPLSWLEPDYEAHAALPAPLRITLHEDFEGQFTAHMVGEEDVTGAVFTMVAVENDEVAANGGGTSHLPYHARVFLTAATGDAFEIAAGESTDITKSFAVDPSWDYAQMGVACWVQKPGGTNPSPAPLDVPITNEVLQSAFVATMSSGVEESVASGLSLLPPSPNPFPDAVTLAFEVPAAGRVSLDVFDVAGRRVARVLDAEVGRGPHAVCWDGLDAGGRSCAAGVYFARLVDGTGEAAVARLVRLR